MAAVPSDLWNRTEGRPVEAGCREQATAIKAALSIPVIINGGSQGASLVPESIIDGYCDGVTLARPLIANNDLPQIWASGRDLPDRPCSFCNRCLIVRGANPLGCYDERRFDGRGGREAMLEEVMSVFRPAPVRRATRARGRERRDGEVLHDVEHIPDEGP